MNNTLLSTIKLLPNANQLTYYVAYSGGIDSTVLLHFLHQQGLSVHAVHINHQLQPGIDELTVAHCTEQCRAWNIPFTLKTVEVKKNKGENIKVVGRTIRYAVLAELLDENSVMCMAHHQDDQAETLLLQLLRGAGAAGLAAMPALSPLGKSYLFRPFLSVTRKELYEYAVANDINWMDDPSNENTDYDRNYIRHEVMPILKKRWPSASQTLSRSATHCAEAASLVEEIALQDYAQVCDKNSLSVKQCLALPAARQRQVLRHWIIAQDFLCPSTAQLDQIRQQLLHARKDAEPFVSWAGACVRRYQDNLFIEARETAHHTTEAALADLASIEIPWDLKQPLELPIELFPESSQQTRMLTIESVLGRGLSQQKLSSKVITVRFRAGTVRCHPVGRSHSQTLKKLFQEYKIPPWKRSQIPLIYCGEELAAVVGYWVCKPFAASSNELGWLIDLKLQRGK